MDCASYTQRCFRDSKIIPTHYAQAYTVAHLGLVDIENSLWRLGWQQAADASGTIRAVTLVIKTGGHGDSEIDPDGLAWSKRKVLKLGDVEKPGLGGIKLSRRTIFLAGLTILEAILDALELEQVVRSEGILHEGVLYDLVGRHRHKDVRKRTISSLMQCYHADPE